MGTHVLRSALQSQQYHSHGKSMYALYFSVPSWPHVHRSRAKRIGKQKNAYLCATLSRPPTNLLVSRAADLDQHKHRHLHALRAVSSAQKQQFGK